MLQEIMYKVHLLHTYEPVLMNLNLHLTTCEEYRHF